MLADAVLAEGYRLLRSRTTWFWSVLFVPILSLTFSVIGNTFLKAKGAALAAQPNAPPEVALALGGRTVDLGQALVTAAGGLAGPMTLLFVLIGAATLYAGDYRWETWRLVTARNSRSNLILGKVGVLKALALAAMIALMISAVAESLLKAVIMAKPLVFTFNDGDFGRLVGFFFLSFWRIVQFTMLALLAAVMTRSLLVALFAPLVIGVAQFFSLQILRPFGVEPDSWLHILINPGAAADILKAWLMGGTAADLLGDGDLAKAIVSLLFWMLAPLAGAIAWFNRQDLAKE